MSTIRTPMSVFCLALLVCGLGTGMALAREVVATGDAEVVVEDGYVRIRTDEGVTEVAGDWRQGGDYTVSDTDRILVELGATRADDHIRLALGGDVLFDFASDAIRSDAALQLAKVAHLIRSQARGEVLVVGHTDSVGDQVANQKLSEARAVSVIRWLGSKEGIPASILVGRGMGERQPVAHNTLPDGSDDPAGRAKNRRVELFLATTEKADVRTIAGTVRIEGDRVEVGDVKVDERGGVQVGGITVSSSGDVSIGGGVKVAAPSGAVSCAAGKTCTADCPEGDCTMTCPAGAICQYGCRGGNCVMSCSAGARCNFTCSGGDCEFRCALGATCETSCAGDGCTGS